jgi:hypothetical protein
MFNMTELDTLPPMEEPDKIRKSEKYKINRMVYCIDNNCVEVDNIRIMANKRVDSIQSVVQEITITKNNFTEIYNLLTRGERE